MKCVAVNKLITREVDRKVAMTVSIILRLNIELEFQKDQLAQHMLTHRITVNGKRQLTLLNATDASIGGVQPVPTVSNSVTTGKVNGNEQSKQVSVVLF